MKDPRIEQIREVICLNYTRGSKTRSQAMELLDELEAELAAHKAVDQINTVRVQKGEPVTVGIPGKHWRRK